MRERRVDAARALERRRRDDVRGQQLDVLVKRARNARARRPRAVARRAQAAEALKLRQQARNLKVLG